MSSTRRTLAPQYVGAVPAPVIVQVTDEDGAPIDLTGATAQFRWRRDAGTAVDGTASIGDPAAGEFRVTWTGAEFSAPGWVRGVGWWEVSPYREVAIVVEVQVLEPPVPID